MVHLSCVRRAGPTLHLRGKSQSSNRKAFWGFCAVICWKQICLCSCTLSCRKKKKLQNVSRTAGNCFDRRCLNQKSTASAPSPHLQWAHDDWSHFLNSRLSSAANQRKVRGRIWIPKKDDRIQIMRWKWSRFLWVKSTLMRHTEKMNVELSPSAKWL